MPKSHNDPALKTELKNFSVRIGKIFSNISIVSLILCSCGVLSFALTALIFLVGLSIIVFSVGTIFLIVPNYFEKLTSVASVSAGISGFFLQNLFIFAIVSFFGALISFILLVLDKQTKHKGRLVVSSIVIIISIIAIILAFTGVAKWKH